MTQIVGVLEGYYDHVLKFLEFFHGKEYANGKAKVRARMGIPVTLTINEIGREEFLKDLKGFSHNSDFDLNDQSWKGKKESGQAVKNKLRKVFKLIRRVTPIKNIEKEINSLEHSYLRKKEAKLGNHFLCDFHLMGEVKDCRYLDGSEVV